MHNKAINTHFSNFRSANKIARWLSSKVKTKKMDLKAVSELYQASSLIVAVKKHLLLEDPNYCKIGWLGRN